jgi:hypothetical protein
MAGFPDIMQQGSSEEFRRCGRSSLKNLLQYFQGVSLLRRLEPVEQRQLFGCQDGVRL